MLFLFCYFSINNTSYLADTTISLCIKKIYHKSVVRKHKQKYKEVVALTVRQRVLALRLYEKQKKNPELAKQLGIEIKIVEKDEKKNQNIQEERSE